MAQSPGWCVGKSSEGENNKISSSANEDVTYSVLRTFSEPEICSILGPKPYEKIRYSPWDVYKGKLEGTPVVVHVLEPHQNTAEIALQIYKRNHIHVAKFLGWCRDSRSIVVEGGTGQSLWERVLVQGLPWQDCCRIADEVVSAVQYLDSKGISVEISSYLIFFDENDNSKLVYVLDDQILVSRNIGYMLRRMMVARLLDLTSPAFLIEELDPRGGTWPNDVITKMGEVVTACLTAEPPPSLDDVASNLASVARLAAEADRRLKFPFSPSSSRTEFCPKTDESTFADDIWLISPEQVARATDGFSNKIGGGGFGEVYKGHLDGLKIAVKKLVGGRATQSFKREVQLLHGLRHPHVLSLIGFEPKSFCLVSEYMAGGTLLDWLRGERGTLTWEDKVRICREMAAAVLHMHGRQVVHRDLKLANVLLDEHKRSKICDMGLAKLFFGNNVKLPNMEGTRGYMDPYSVTSGCVGKLSDTYALGLIILQLLTGIWSIQDIHTLLGQFEKPTDTGFTSLLGNMLKDSSTLGTGMDLSTTSETNAELATPAATLHSTTSRWVEDPNDFEEIVKEFSKHLDPGSAKMPREALWKTVSLLLRCIERTWELRANLGDLLPALEELEVMAKKVEAEESHFLDCEAPDFLLPTESEKVSQLVVQERVIREKQEDLQQRAATVKVTLEVLIASQETLQQDTAMGQKRSEWSKKVLSELLTKTQSASNLDNIEEAAHFLTAASHLVDNMGTQLKEMQAFRSKLEEVEKDIKEQKVMASTLEEDLLEREREMAVVRCERLRMVGAAARQGKKAAAEIDEFEKALFLLEKAKAADKEADELQKKYGLQGKQFDR